jgi:hypothetical protein
MALIENISLDTKRPPEEFVRAILLVSLFHR